MLFIRSHPQMQSRALPTLNLGLVRVEMAPGFWILPSFAIVGAVCVLPAVQRTSSR